MAEYDMPQVEAAYATITDLVSNDLNHQFDSNRIKGTEYADTYQALMNTALQLAMDAPLKAGQLELQAQEILLKQAQVALSEKELEIKEQELLIRAQELLLAEKALIKMDAEISNMAAQEALYIRQEEGFDDDLRRKMLDIQMNTWAMMFSSGLLTEKPSIITNDEVSDLYCYMKSQVVPDTVPC